MSESTQTKKPSERWIFLLFYVGIFGGPALGFAVILIQQFLRKQPVDSLIVQFFADPAVSTVVYVVLLSAPALWGAVAFSYLLQRWWLMPFIYVGLMTLSHLLMVYG